MKRADKRQMSGEFLVADFQSAFAALATANYAQSEAQRSENAIVSELHGLSSQTYLNPGSINPVRQNDIGRASLNAHVMKVQAAQLQHMSREQLVMQQTQVTADYLGRKVRITTRGNDENPFDVVWFNSRTGYRTNVYKKPRVIGTIIEIDLAKNLLIVKPRLLSRLINREFAGYFVYVINPATFQPTVTIELL